MSFDLLSSCLVLKLISTTCNFESFTPRMFKEKKPYFTAKQSFKSEVQVERKDRTKLEIIEKIRYNRLEDERIKFEIVNRDLLDGNELERIDEDDREFEIGKINN